MAKTDQIRAELLALQQADPEKMLRAPAAVAWARDNPTSALHSSLEWDDAVAAEEHRIWQVRQLVRLHVLQSDGTPQLVSLTLDRKAQGGYRDVQDVLKSRTMTEIMLADALAELERVKVKFERIQELASVWAEVETVKRRSRRRVTEQPAIPQTAA